MSDTVTTDNPRVQAHRVRGVSYTHAYGLSRTQKTKSTTPAHAKRYVMKSSIPSSRMATRRISSDWANIVIELAASEKCSTLVRNHLRSLQRLSILIKNLIC